MQELFNAHGWRITQDSVALPSGKQKAMVRVHHSDRAHIVAYKTPHTILLLREYRPFYAQHVWMLPSGHIDKERDPLVAAQRELREETGYRADQMQHLYSVQHSEAFTVTNHFFRGTQLVHDPLPQDADEMIEVHECTVDDAIDRILTSPRIHMPSAFVLLALARGAKKAADLH